ncbi:MAG: hypothetical protein JRH20_05525 [Deltaproteobacteria bacterium]|nr:hypothetical protein [Deltaproteobacteria bacterium]
MNTSSSPELPSTKSRLVRRLPAYLLLMGGAAVLMHYWRQQPHDLDVVYHLGKKAVGLQSLSATYLRGDEVLAMARFSYRTTPAKPEQRHQVRLPPGDFEVALELGYSDVGGEKTRIERVRRRILSRGSGEVSVFIADDS